MWGVFRPRCLKQSVEQKNTTCAHVEGFRGDLTSKSQETEINLFWQSVEKMTGTIKFFVDNEEKLKKGVDYLEAQQLERAKKG